MQETMQQTMPEPVVMHSDNVGQLAFDSFPDTNHGTVFWKTLLSSGLQNASNNNMCAGIATCPSNGALALHRHTQAEMYYVLSGTGVVEVEGVKHYVQEGSMVWIPGDAEHGVFCGPEEELKWLYVFPEGRFENIQYRFKVPS